MVGDDASAMFYNPAGMAMMQQSVDFFSNRTQWIADISYSAAGLAKNLGNWGTVGASFIFSDYGDIIGTRVDATKPEGYEKTGNIDVGAYAIGVSYARSLTDKFSVGGQVKYAAQHLGSSVLKEGGKAVKNEVSGFAFDFGTIFYPGFKSLRVGMSVRNFSGQFQYEETPFQLPLTFKIGVAMNVMDLLGEYENPLLIAIDALHPRDYTERIHVGTEYWFKDMFALRVGYKFNYDVESFTAGLGFKYAIAGKNLKLDYSYGALGVFSSVSRFSIGISL